MSDYSPTWYELFLEPLAPEQTEREVAFVARWLPLLADAALIDLCCGQGRHARALARRGYRVTGVDTNAAALAQAKRASRDEITYLQLDMRRLAELPGSFDGLICMWQSFGYFDAATNADILRQVGAKLRPGGRLILDIYHPGFFERNQGARRFERAGRTIAETKRMDGDRLTVMLDYGPDLPADTYAWQLFLPDDIAALAHQYGFTLLLACANFDEATPPSAELPRMQLVLER
ncbi:MAG TPA: class I SAM-dependent methyltransferase [Roseiflexaceae bacterium]|nr:class I SAM-dependent methyltransferase [Roseiflexaceae bacterium]